ncbi:MAG: 2-oxoacid:acceptor oxidoreductase family protein [Nanoarchaeota archaeon]|nr:2-oxoacid:acceptor oxidoreductase family protein [Nanoarchaeota archaeon]
MYEVRFHGRGGQGVKLSAHILGTAAFLSEFQTQDFAIYGAERRGAPVTSFCRIDKKEILSRGYIFEPDAVVVLDKTISEKTVLKGVKNNTVIVINAPEKLKKFQSKKGKIFYIDATKIAMKNLGKPIPNAAILGSFLKIAKLFPLEKLKMAIKEELQKEGHSEAVKGNVKACEECYNNTDVK